MKVISATGLLANFVDAGIINQAGFHLARTLGRLTTEPRPEVQLAAALLVAAQSKGSVCLRIDETLTDTFPATEPEIQVSWPQPATWLEMLRNSPMVSNTAEVVDLVRPLRLIGNLLYLERFWQAETLIAETLTSRWNDPSASVSTELARKVTEQVADKYFPGRTSPTQRDAVVTALSAATSVISGGPGTGKTTTIALLLKALDELEPAGKTLRVEMASFTGKAAARMQESLSAATGSFAAEGWRRIRVNPAKTLHKLLEFNPSSGPMRNKTSPLTCDVLVIDEMSMVSLSLMAKVIAAVLPSTKLVLVGDAGQLSSIESGAVFADLVTAGMTVSATDDRSAIIELTESHRFSGAIAELAAAVRAGDTEAAIKLLAAGDPNLIWHDLDASPAKLNTELESICSEIITQAQRAQKAALCGDGESAIAALQEHRVLCAHRQGRYGVSMWSLAIESLLKEQLPGYGIGRWYFGRPLLITKNLNELGISNGDTGVVINRDGVAAAGLATGAGIKYFSPMMLDSVGTLHAMTIHKSQGSEYDAVTIILPPQDSPLLTKELIYTALTRAKSKVRIVGTQQALLKALTTPVRRASGLAERLQLHPACA